MTPVSALSQKDTDSKALVVSQLGEGIHLRRREPRARGGGVLHCPAHAIRLIFPCRFVCARQTNIFVINHSARRIATPPASTAIKES